MRRVGSYVLIMLGFLFLFLAPFLRFYAVPRLEKAPLDRYQKIVATGYGRYFNTSPKFLRLVGPVPVENTQTFRGDPTKGTTTDASYGEFNSLKDLQHNSLIQATKLQVVFDRTTGYAVHCCGENPKEEGITIKFPFDTQKTTYQLYDNGGARAFPVKFVREGNIQGLTVYVFHGSGGPVVIGHLDVAGTLVGQPDQKSVTADISYLEQTTTWIEPVTGAVIKGQQHAVQYLSFQGQQIQPLADLQLTYDDATVTDNATKSKQDVKQLKLVKSGIPIFGPIIGIVLLVLGILLLRGQRAPRAPRVRRTTQPAAAEEPSA
ncbi:MAG: DUF3068 domain-containing protein [Actinomycetota bacterium]|nr:DUF3068 domain-containing protein [Actinomycetota bacterium]